MNQEGIRKRREGLTFPSIKEEERNKETSVFSYGYLERRSARLYLW